MKALYFRYCFGKIIEASMYSLAYNRLSNFPVAYRTAGYLACANCYAGYAKTRWRVTRCCSGNFLTVETTSTLLYAKKQQPLNCEAIPVFLIAW